MISSGIFFLAIGSSCFMFTIRIALGIFSSPFIVLVTKSGYALFEYFSTVPEGEVFLVTNI